MDTFPYVTTNLWPTSQRRLVSGRGLSVFDTSGSEYLDLTCQTLNLAFGHCHPKISEAVSTQLQNIWFCSSRFGSQPFLDLSALLIAVAPAGLTAVNLKLCDGSDAVETAIKLARLHTRAKKLLCIRQAWHGETSGTLGLCSLESTKEYVVTETNVVFSDDSTLESLAHGITQHSDLAAVIIDPVGVSNGLFKVDDCAKWLPEIRLLCTKNDIVLIFDEIQTFGGFLGTHLFAADYFNVVPDIICLGKALGAGLPLAATLCRDQFRALLDYNNAEFTYGGQALSCAAGLSALTEYVSHAPEIASSSRDWANAVEEYLQNIPEVEVRRYGFITTITQKTPRFRESWTSEIVRRALDARLIVRSTNHYGSVLLKPPLLIPAAAAESACAKLREIILSLDSTAYQRHLRTKPVTPNKNMAYVDELLQSLGPGFSSKLRSSLEQEAVSEQLNAAGVPVNKVFARDAMTVEYWHQEGTPMHSILRELTADGDFALINGLLVRQQNAIEMAHSQSLVIGDRWPGNTIVSGSNIVFIDFDLAYTGEFHRLCLFEEMFSLLQFLAHIPRRDFLGPLSARFANGIARRFNRDEVLSMWLVMKGFYARSDKPTVSSSLSLEVYASVLTVLSKHFVEQHL